MPFIGNKPSAVPLTSADITDNIIVNADINTSAGITTEKLSLISTASVASVTAKGTPSVSDGYIQLNCEQNSHGIKIKSPPHSAGANYTLVMPSATGTSEQVLRMNTGATALEFASASSDFVKLAETSASNVASVALNGYFTSSYDVYKIYIDGVYGSSTAYAAVTFNTTGSYTEQTSSYCFVMGGYRETNANTEGSIYNSGDSASSIYFLQAENSITAGGSAEFVLFNPMSTSHYKLITGNISSRISTYISTTGFCGSWDNTTAITGITFKMSTGNMYARKIRIYGIKN